MINQALWIGTASVLVLLVVRAINTDGMASALSFVLGRPAVVPGSVLPWLALFFGGASATLNGLVNGADLQTSIAGGLVSAATAVFGHSLGKSIPGVRAVVKGRTDKAKDERPSPLPRIIPSILLLIGAMSLGAASSGCPGAASPTNDAEAGAAFADAAAPIVNVCDLIEGVDPGDKIVRSVCATVEEILQVVGYILTLRASDVDAGKRASSEPCLVLPHTTTCATSSERAKGIKFLVHLRAARYLRDGGAR